MVKDNYNILVIMATLTISYMISKSQVEILPYILYLFVRHLLLYVAYMILFSYVAIYLQIVVEGPDYVGFRRRKFALTKKKFQTKFGQKG